MAVHKTVDIEIIKPINFVGSPKNNITCLEIQEYRTKSIVSNTTAHPDPISMETDIIALLMLFPEPVKNYEFKITF